MHGTNWFFFKLGTNSLLLNISDSQLLAYCHSVFECFPISFPFPQSCMSACIVFVMLEELVLEDFTFTSRKKRKRILHLPCVTIHIFFELLKFCFYVCNKHRVN
jgi:hypothetical protein